MKELVDRLVDGEELYLTTQYVEDEVAYKHQVLMEAEKHGNDEDEDDEDDDEEDGESGGFGFGVPQSDNESLDSIDMNNLKDDFDDLEDDGDIMDETQDEEVISDELLGEPLTLSEAQDRVQSLFQRPLNQPLDGCHN
ncbi:unnamed protein product [Ambrosiozyma monospora]|uniref:Unnamed protein product n=1 Tax=Ambrosiozyma monospora TaxID=43982 RepID=A0ACB5UC81_AMBMO|nr:unnamed protein product [Ambrosiozyma monospora]